MDTTENEVRLTEVRLATISAEIREYLIAETDATRPGFHATAITHRIAPLLLAEVEAGRRLRAGVEALAGEWQQRGHIIPAPGHPHRGVHHYAVDRLRALLADTDGVV